MTVKGKDEQERLPLARAMWPPTEESAENAAAISAFNDNTLNASDQPTGWKRFDPPVLATAATKAEPVPKSEEDTAAATRQYWGRFDLPEAAARPVTDEEERDAEMGSVPVAQAKVDDREVRHAFIRKVYSILSVQMLVTFGVCAFMTLHKPTQTYVLQNGQWLLYLSIGMSFIVLFLLFCNKRNYPTNMILLGFWTLTEAYLIGTVTAFYASAGYSGTVLEAVFLTATVFLVLTLFTLQSKWDFSFMGAGLGMCLWVLVLWSFAGLFLGFQTGYVFALIGAVVFSGYIIFDTWMITERLDPEDYIVAVIELYLDIINLFLMILQLLSNDRN